MFCACNEAFFFVQCHNFSLKKKKTKLVLKTWISRRVFYFVGILNKVADIFLPGYPQVFSLLNLRFRGIFEPQKSPV